MISKKELAKKMFAKPEDIIDNYRITPDDLRIMIQQTSCSEDEANEYFNKNKGDLENAIIDYLESTNVLQKDHRDDLLTDQDLLKDEISTHDKMPKYRDILNKKDAIFQEKFDESSNFDDYQIVNLEYVPFSQSTNNYRKMKFKGTKEFFSLEILRPYLEGTLNDNELWDMSKTNREKDNQKEKIKLYHNVEMTISHENDDVSDTLDITTTTSDITTTTSDITTTTSDITTTTSDITINTSDITINTSDITKNTSDTTTSTSDTTTNTSDTTTNTSDTTTTTSDITKNTSDITKNTLDITKNKLDIIEMNGEKVKLPSAHKIVLKKLVGQGATMAKKWTCYNPVIAFLDQESIGLLDVNVLASKFMRNSGYLSGTETIRGSAVVIDNWFL
jgi:hypothetical protein